MPKVHDINIVVGPKRSLNATNCCRLENYQLQIKGHTAPFDVTLPT